MILRIFMVILLFGILINVVRVETQLIENRKVLRSIERYIAAPYKPFEKGIKGKYHGPMPADWPEIIK